MDEMKESPVKGIVKALSEFQQACPAIKKDSTAKGTKFTYKYGSLPHVLEEIKPHMKKAGLTFTQPIVFRDGNEFIYTTLYHVESGEKIESKMLLPEFEFDQMNKIQSKGSVITYYRRYALMAILGIVAEEDDNDAQGKEKRSYPRSETGKPETATKEKPWLNPKINGQTNHAWVKAIRFLAKDGTIEQVKAKYRISKANEEKLLNEAISYEEPDVIEAEPNQPNLNFDQQSGREFPPDYEEGSDQ